MAALLPKLFAAYVAADADLVEINPLVLTGDGEVVALDAKVTLDDNAAFRHPEWAEWRASEALDPRERRARDKGLNYVGLDGTVGIIGNGAGLVMATLDVVSQAGGSAANFLDIGGGASAEVMAAALEVVASDEKVGAIFVNIFGGITRGDEVANGILQALAADRRSARPSSSASTAPTPRRAGPSSPTTCPTACARSPPCPTPPAPPSPWPTGGRREPGRHANW